MSDIGFNLASVSYWTTEEPFIDRIHTGGLWTARNASGADISSTLTRDTDGNFTSLVGVSKLNLSVAVDPKSASTSDEYVLTYDGTAKVSITNATIVSQTAGKVVFDYTGNQAYGSVYITFSNINASDPVTDPHLVRADQMNLFNQGEIFNPDFVAKVSQWSMVRFMDWGNTNPSAAVSWATRTTLDDTFWSKQVHSDGVPIEAMVKLCNEAHVDMYYNMPTMADDTYVTQALTYIRDHLDPSLKVHVEWSNEVWNTDFTANKYSQSQADALWGNGTTVKYGANIYYGYRSAQIADIAHDVFTGSHAGQVVDVLAGQNAGASTLTYILQGVAKAGDGAASSLFGEYAVAPYFGSEMGTNVSTQDLQTIVGWAKSGAAGMDAAFQELEFGGTLHNNGSLAKAIAGIAKSGEVAAANGLHLVAYEGGLSLATTRWDTTDTPVVQDFFNRLMDDPRMGELYAKEMAAFTAAGGTTFNFYNDAGTSSDSGTWGALQTIYDDGGTLYDAILGAADPKSTGDTAISAPPVSQGDTSVDPGTVTGDTSVDPGTVTGDTGTGTGTTTGDTGTGTGDTGTGTGDISTGAGDVSTGTGTGDTSPGTGTGDTGTGTNNGTASEAPPATSGHITGTSGADHLFASSDNDTVDGGAGDDVITGSSSTMDAHGHLIETDVYMGGVGADTIVGGDGNDHIYGNAITTVAGSVDGADSLSGGGGMDYLQGNAGADTIDGGEGNDRVYGGADNDSLMGNTGDDYLQGNKGDDTASGGDGNDTVHGGADNDVLYGDAGNDQLLGDAGNDTMTGGAGLDTMTGGAGNDTFVFSAHDAAFATSGTTAWQTDEITDFTHALDKIVLDFHASQVWQGTASSAATAFTQASALLTGHHGDVAAVVVGNDTYLFWDSAHGTGAIDSAVKIDHVHDGFTLADFG